MIYFNFLEPGGYCYADFGYQLMQTYKLGYCKNRYLVHAIIEIGEHTFGCRRKLSAYQRGIICICEQYEKMYHEHLYKSEVKRLVRPNKKHKSCLKIPKNTLRILECIAFCIHHFDDSKKLCYNRNANFYKDNTCLLRSCFRYLVSEMYKALSLVNLDPCSSAYDIYSDLRIHTKKCSL